MLTLLTNERTDAHLLSHSKLAFIFCGVPRVTGSGMDGYSTAIYFIVMPVVLGPICAVAFVVAVCLCRRRHPDGRPPSTVKGALAASARLPPTLVDRRKTPATPRLRGGVDVGVDAETQMMLPCSVASGGLLASQLPTYHTGR